MSFEASLVRRALDYLLDAYPTFDLLDIDWQRGFPEDDEPAHPWVLVYLGQPGEGETEAFAVWPFAIWKATGALHRMEAPLGPVSDDPIWTP